ncbi:hypothetical protein D3C87_1841960 [compost metagenome]
MYFSAGTGMRASLRARFSVFSFNWSAGTTLLMRCMRKASSASTVSPVNISQRTSRVASSQGIISAGGPELWRTSGSPNLALSAAIARSQHIISSSAPASA